ncbi:MAG: SWIM zinc finger family protein [Planctomycetota bacterium]
MTVKLNDYQQQKEDVSLVVGLLVTLPEEGPLRQLMARLLDGAADSCARMRAIRGIAIWLNYGVTTPENGYHFLVKSQTSDHQYKVILGGGQKTCECGDFVDNGHCCKHLVAVWMAQHGRALVF